MIEGRRRDDDAPFAPMLLKVRFPALTRRPQPAHGVIDACHGLGRDVAPDHAPRAIARGATIYVAGWIWSPEFTAAEQEVIVTIDGAFAAIATAGHARADIAQMHGPLAGRAGFEAFVPSGALQPGEHTLTVVRLTDALSYVAGPQRRFTVVNAALRTRIETPIVPGIDVQIDALGDASEAREHDAGAPVLPLGATLRVMGWAADLAVGQPCAAVYAVVDDVHFVRGRYGIERGDVAHALGVPGLTFCGFDVRIDIAAFGIGDHDVRVVALSANGEGRSELTPPQFFRVSAQD